MQHRLSQQHSQTLSERKALNFEPYIQLEQERISRSRSEFHGVRFNLDKDIIEAIQYAREIDRPLYLSRKLLADLRYYALSNSENQLQSGLTFHTYYLRGSSQEALMRSVILPDGEVLHQIQRDCLERPDFCRQVASAHFWLIDQLLSQLRLGAFLKLNRFVQVIAWFIAAAIALAFVPLLIQISPWMLLGLVAIAWLLQKVMQILLRPLLPAFSRWVLRQVLSGLLSHKLMEKKIAMDILGRLAP